MDIRVLRYFLAVAREENITRAAEMLHIAQPTLSKQLMELEEELGKQLLIRGKRKITLTEDGVLLRKRAEEIVNLVQKTKDEISSDFLEIHGEISIGGNPTESILRAASLLRKEHEGVRFQFFSGDGTAVTERLDHGSLDFAVLLPPVDTEKYDYIMLPETSDWGLLMRTDSPLAVLPSIDKDVLLSIPLVVHQRTGMQQRIALWAGADIEAFDIAATYNVVHGNSIAFAESGLGYFLAPRDLLAPELGKGICFKKLDPPLKIHYALVWKRNPLFSKAAEVYVGKIKEILS